MLIRGRALRSAPSLRAVPQPRLVPCPTCRQQVSTFAVTCPKCGHPDPGREEREVDIEVERLNAPTPAEARAATRRKGRPPAQPAGGKTPASQAVRVLVAVVAALFACGLCNSCGDEHARQIAEADLRHPIALSPDGRVMDGMHRVARAFLEGRSEIEVVRLPTEPEPDFVGVRIDEPPYDEGG
jgi:hypothetical protein